MERRSRKEIEDLLDHLLKVLKETKEEIAKIDEQLKDKDSQTDDLLREKEILEDNLREIETDIGTYQEMLHIILMNETVDTRCDETEESYDGYEEVFTGGEY